MYRGLLPFTRTSCIYCVLGNEQSLSFLLRVASDCIRFHPDCTVSRIFSTQLLKAAFSISFKHYVSVSWMLTGTELHGISEDFTVWFTREVRPWKGCPGRNPFLKAVPGRNPSWSWRAACYAKSQLKDWTFRKRKRQSQDAIFHTLGCRQDLRCALSVEISFTVWHSSLLLHSQNLAESRRIWHLAEPAQIFWNCAI